MRAWRGLALVALAAVLAVPSAGCKCAWYCLKSPPAPPAPATQTAQDTGEPVVPPPSTRGGVISIARSNNPLQPIGFVSFDPEDGRHSWWLMSQGEIVLPYQTMLAGMPAPPDQILIWTPIHETSKYPPQLCLDHGPSLTNPVLWDVFLTAAPGDCP